MSQFSSESIQVNRPRPVVSPTFRLFVFHHAGGSSYSYSGWHRFLPDDWDLAILDFPGRGVNSELPLRHDLEGLVDATCAAVLAYADVPFAFHGHSVGGLVAYASARKMESEMESRPVFLGISSAKPPTYTGVEKEREILNFSNEELLAYLRRFGGAPQGLTDSPELLEAFLKLLRADVSAVLNFRHQEVDPLSIPFFVYGASDDTFAPEDLLNTWSLQSQSWWFHRQTFSGDHFFVLKHQDQFVPKLVNDIRASMIAL